jgi:predicted  nucleic acid-binding Zn-ribbon protein
MAFLSKTDPVAAARKALEDAEAAATAASKRVADIDSRIEAFGLRAAEIDPESEKDFAKATHELAELRASAEILAVRQTTARERVEAARSALARAELATLEAEFADMAARIARADSEIEADVLAFREALAARMNAGSDLERRAEELYGRIAIAKGGGVSRYRSRADWCSPANPLHVLSAAIAILSARGRAS